MVPVKELSRLESERNIWLASTRVSGKPHLIPIWFVWHGEQIYMCMKAKSVKAQNMLQNPQVSLALENGSNPVICEGTAVSVPQPWSEKIQVLFKQKYDWDIFTDEEYDWLVAVTPHKWLTW